MSNKATYIRLTIPGKPFGKQRPRVLKNGITYTPKETVDYETFIKELYMADGQIELLEGPLYMEIKAYYPIPQSTSKLKKESMLKGYIRPTKKPDIDNIAKVIADALNGLAYADDKQIVSCYVEKYYSEKPRVEVSIQEIKMIEEDYIFDRT